MIAPDQIPATYQQWLACFQHMQEHPGDQGVHALMLRGSFPGQISETYKSRLSETVGAMLTYHCRWFLRETDQALANGEPDMVALLAVRFRRKVQKCLFYRDLPFLEDSFVKILDEGFCAQVRAFWKDFLFQLKATANESSHTELEDVLLEMSRVRII